MRYKITPFKTRFYFSFSLLNIIEANYLHQVPSKPLATQSLEDVMTDHVFMVELVSKDGIGKQYHSAVE